MKHKGVLEWVKAKIQEATRGKKRMGPRPFRRFKPGEDVPDWLLSPNTPFKITFIKEADVYHVGEVYHVYPVEEIKADEILIECVPLTSSNGIIDSRDNWWHGVPYGQNGMTDGAIIYIAICIDDEDVTNFICSPLSGGCGSAEGEGRITR